MKGLICFYWIYSPATALHVLSTKNRPKPSDRRILYCTVYSIQVHHPAKNSQKRNEICVRPTFHHSTLVRSLVLRWGRTHLAPLHPGEWWGAWSWGGGRTHLAPLHPGEEPGLEVGEGLTLHHSTLVRSLVLRWGKDSRRQTMKSFSPWNRTLHIPDFKTHEHALITLLFLNLIRIWN